MVRAIALMDPLDVDCRHQGLTTTRNGHIFRTLVCSHLPYFHFVTQHSSKYCIKIPTLITKAKLYYNHLIQINLPSIPRQITGTNKYPSNILLFLHLNSKKNSLTLPKCKVKIIFRISLFTLDRFQYGRRNNRKSISQHTSLLHRYNTLTKK